MRGRPRKIRIVQNEPGTKQFSPRGAIGRPSHKEIKYEEVEAIRLADFTGLSQAEAARSMGVSQQTFSRILRSGRKCLAEALVLGRIIKVKGGDFSLKEQTRPLKGSRHE